MSTTMRYYIIQKINRENTIIGMSRMPTPSVGMPVLCILKVDVTIVGDKHIVTISHNKNTVFPVTWEKIYVCREISKVEYENYIEFKLFTFVRDNWYDRFVKKFKRAQENTRKRAQK